MDKRLHPDWSKMTEGKKETVTSTHQRFSIRGLEWMNKKNEKLLWKGTIKRRRRRHAFCIVALSNPIRGKKKGRDYYAIGGISSKDLFFFPLEAIWEYLIVYLWVFRRTILKIHNVGKFYTYKIIKTIQDH